MDSINRNQPEDHRKDLHAQEAVQRIKDVIDKTQTCFFCTSPDAGSETGGARPMNVRQVDDAGNLWFLSANDSHKNLAISRDPNVSLYLQGTEHSDFLHLRGRASIGTDKAKIKELWQPILRTWFTGGIDDPRISVIRFKPREGYYWDNKHGNTVAGLKMLVGAAIGQTLDDSIEGRLSFPA